MTKLKDWFFRRIHGNKLIYNTYWEDPRCDRMLMDIQPDSNIVMITSAGCNALDYLLDEPESIHCVDMNYRQNALLELKIASIKNLHEDHVFALFGNGYLNTGREVYQTALRDSLSENAKRYWDKNIKYFTGLGFRRSFYYRGASGLLAYGITRLLNLKSKIRKNVKYLFESISLEEQSIYFSYLEKVIFSNKLVEKALNNPYTLSLAGVPQSQISLMDQSYQGGALEYVKDSARKIFTTVEISDNYFYQVYLHGQYTQNCCPEYLKEQNLPLLKTYTNRIQTYTTTISEFLRDNPGKYSHFVLLDHQDWLSENNMEALIEEWRLILKNSHRGTKILLRSAAKEITFFPDFIKHRVVFDQEKTAIAHQADRVGTYASVYLGIVQ